MVNDIRPSPSPTQKIGGSPFIGRQADLLRQIVRMRNAEYGVQNNSVIHNQQSAGGVSVVEEVFNQIYSKSGFLKEEEAVPIKRERLGTQLDVYA